jgi:hypothetical protein
MAKQLEGAYAHWRDEPLPPGSSRDDIDELHADLVTVDLWVADMVIPYVENGTRFPLKVDIEGGIERVRERIRQLLESAYGADRSLLDRYAAYTDLLDAVFRAYRRESTA